MIEISQEATHLRQEIDDRIHFSLGLIVEKWLYYYFPLFAHDEFVPQKHGETEEQVKGNRLSFRPSFQPIIDYYTRHHGHNNAYTAFMDDFRFGTVPLQLTEDLKQLLQDIRHTIKNQPMRYLGKSVSNTEYSIFQYETSVVRYPDYPVDRKFIIDNFDSFSFSKNLYELFHFIGSFIAGENSILTSWAEFTQQVDKTGTINMSKTIELLKTTPVDSRDVKEVRQYFLDKLETEHLVCVWSGQTITSESQLDIDHVLPFSIWKNNDIWNLLPARSEINGKKRDKIPSEEVLEASKSRLNSYWIELKEEFGDLFMSQLELGLTGRTDDDWIELAFAQLKEKCDYLITIRGHEPFMEP